MGLGVGPGEGFVFGLALSVASTVVLLRALDERGGVETAEGRVAVGWLLVEDIVMVVALVVLPSLAGALGGSTDAGGDGSLVLDLVLTLAKLVAFVALMLVVGRRVVPTLPAGLNGSARTTCSCSRCSRPRSASPTARRRSSASPWRSAPSSPGSR